MNVHPNDEAIAKVAEIQREGKARLATVIATDNGAGRMQLIYVLDVNGGLATVRCNFDPDEELASLSAVFAGAENMEREIIDLLGVKFEGIKGGLFIEPGSGIVAPLRKQEAGGASS